MLINERNLHRLKSYFYLNYRTEISGSLSHLGAEKIAFPPKPDIQTNRQMDRHK